MKLSEAILEGCKNTIQGFGSESMYSSTFPCVLGAALLGVNIQVGVKNGYFLLREQFKELKQLERHPILYINRTLISIIYDLNDRYRWSREKIADWLVDKGY